MTNSVVVPEFYDCLTDWQDHPNLWGDASLVRVRGLLTEDDERSSPNGDHPVSAEPSATGTGSSNPTPRTMLRDRILGGRARAHVARPRSWLGVGSVEGECRDGTPCLFVPNLSGKPNVRLEKRTETDGAKLLIVM